MYVETLKYYIAWNYWNGTQNTNLDFFCQGIMCLTTQASLFKCSEFLSSLMSPEAQIFYPLWMPHFPFHISFVLLKSNFNFMYANFALLLIRKRGLFSNRIHVGVFEYVEENIFIFYNVFIWLTPKSCFTSMILEEFTHFSIIFS